MKGWLLAARRRFQVFGDHQDGQIAFITLFGAVALVSLLGMVLTTGHQAALKIEMQNTADATALSGGAWIARGLNLTSAINVLQSQLVGGAIALEALDKTLTIAQPAVTAMCDAYLACSDFFPPCWLPALVTCAQDLVLPEIAEAVKGLYTSLAACPSGAFWVGAKALEYLNLAVHFTFFAVAFAESVAVAQADGAEIAVFLPGPLFHGEFNLGLVTLPTKEAEFPALCDPMEHGSPTREVRGYTKLLSYPAGQGPLALGKCRLSRATAFITGFPPIGPFILPMIANQRREMLCEGHADSPNTTYQRPTRDLAECKSLGGTARWRFMHIDTEQLDSPNGCQWLGSQIQDRSAPYEGVPNIYVRLDHTEEEPCSTPPKGDQIAPGTYCYAFRQQVTGSSPAKYLYTLYVQALELTSVKETAHIDSGQAGDCDNVKPKPYLLRDDNDALKFLVIVRRPNSRIFFSSERFLEEPPTLYTYAQVEVYSGISADTFNQDWRVRLDRADLLEKPFERLGPGVSGFLDELAHFSDILPVALPEGLGAFTHGLLADLLNRQTEESYTRDDAKGNGTLRRVLNH